MRKIIGMTLLGAFMLSCQSKGQDCSAELDGDNDGVDDCTEADIGTDPLLADSDGDGLSDKEEMDCVSDPLNAEETCYACGWKRNNPGTLASTGSETGDIMANLQLEDQCGEVVDTWDFYGEYHVLYMTAAW